MPSDESLTGEGNVAGIGKGLRNMVGILWIVLVVLLVLWFLGFIASVGGGFIHLLLVLALIVLIYNLLTGRRAV
ncbi:MAG TPA: lmo0937 family membrane protein [Thermomicrobiales bacterium]|jgi:uncharacterized protein DUF5670|nr:lmo0937 family membrane protein [Thermomicrobiales bacterium]